MKKIYKYVLATTDSQALLMKKGEILSLQLQNGAPCIWVLVNPIESDEYRYFEIFGTGHTIYEDMGVERRFVGTYQLAGGKLVFHVFEKLGP